jgi:glycosyltransferase involved in cell wall biosynthesis
MTRVAVLIPCLDEATTIDAVVRESYAALPDAHVYVFDNGSVDESVRVAREAGATVRHVPRRGKGEVVRAMFREVDADVYVMADGDGTYDLTSVHALTRPIMEGRADMVVATRLGGENVDAFRPFHVFGNKLVLAAINRSFNASLSDAMSGYRAFSRRFVKTMPVLSQGFEIETEMTLHALEHRLPIEEVSVPYRTRPMGSVSKLRTVPDGAKVLWTIASLFKHYRPMTFFGTLALFLLILGTAAGVLVVLEFLEYGQVIGVARAVVSVACGIVGVLSLITGIVLETVNRRAREIYVLLADHVLNRPSEG